MPGRARLGRLAAWVLPAIALAATGSSCSVSESEERELGAYEAATIDTSVALIDDSLVTGYLTALGRSLTSRTSRANLDWRFAVVNSSAVNAMALPGGFVYVTRAMIEQAGQMDELAGVMSHEIGHVVHRHSVKQLEKAGKREIALLMLCTLTNACRTLGGAIAVQIGADAATAQYSQHDESEADSEAVLITLHAGIDPEGLPTFLKAVMAQRTDRPSPIDAFFASHPTDEARISALDRQIAQLTLKPGQLLRDTPDFHTIQVRLRAMPPPPRDTTDLVP